MSVASSARLWPYGVSHLGGGATRGRMWHSITLPLARHCASPRVIKGVHLDIMLSKRLMYFVSY
jgi:hypothetical protein